MRRGTPVSWILSWGIVAGLFVLGTAWAAPGTVLSNAKISDTVGNFSAVIDNLDEFGGAVCGLGDLDGAGPAAAAIAVGVALDDDASGDRGAVYIIFLNAAGSTISWQKISDLGNLPGAPLDGNDQFGSSLVWLGDLDDKGPSVGTLAVGSPLDDDGGIDRGAIYLLSLSADGTVLAVQKISALEGGFGGALDNLDEFGGSVTNLGDIDGPFGSARAVAVGAGGDDDGGTDRGAVWILFLNNSGTVMSHTKISSTQGNFSGPLDNTDDFGGSVAALHDLDGAGPSVAALAVGASFDDDGGLDRGAVWILFLSPAGSVMSHQKISDTQGNFNDFFSDLDEFGGAVTPLVDFDGIGIGSVAALAVGVAGDDDGGEDRGAIHILFLNPNGTCASSQKISDFFGGFPVPLENLDAFGSSVALIGDLDGAGTSAITIVTGVTGDDDGGLDRGALFILYLDGISPVGVGDVLLPAGAVLGRAWPNPGRPGTMIPFRLGAAAEVSIGVWDLSGRQVRQLLRGQRDAGSHMAPWDGCDDSGRLLSAGTYFYRMSIDGRPVGRAEKVMLLH